MNRTRLRTWILHRRSRRESRIKVERYLRESARHRGNFPILLTPEDVEIWQRFSPPYPHEDFKRETFAMCADRVDYRIMECCEKLWPTGVNIF